MFSNHLLGKVAYSLIIKSQYRSVNIDAFLFSDAGKHVTLVSHSRPVGLCLEAAKELAAIGIEAEVSHFNLHFQNTIKHAN